MQIKTQSTTKKIKTKDLKKLQVSQKDYCKLQNTFLWRYMSLPKFLDLILNRRLYFADLVTLAKEDPYEGALPLYSDYPVYIKKIVDSTLNTQNQNPEIQKILPDYKNIENIANYFKKVKQSTFVNCWHINKNENFAMWKIYACSDASIAIVTDINRLKDSIKTNKNIKGAIVKYNDKNLWSSKSIENIEQFKNYKKIQESVKKAALYKRKCFEYEQEFRLIYQNNDILEQDKNYVNIDTTKLIKYIYISPMAEIYIKNTIIQTLNKIKLNKNFNLNIEKIIKDSSINGNELNDVLGALARYALEEIPKNKELSEEDKSMAKVMLLLWMLASTNSLDVLINEK